MIYIISDGGYVKIGYTNGDVYKRMSTLQTGTVAKLSILGHFPGERTDEQRLHAEFAHRRIAGEWFQLTIEEVGDLIRREAKPSIEQTFSEEGMITIVTDAMNKKLRSLGFRLLTTIRPGMIKMSVSSDVKILSFCEQARDEIVTATLAAITALKLPEECLALTKVYKDKGELSCSVILSHNIYDLRSINIGKFLTYKQMEEHQLASKKAFDRISYLHGIGFISNPEIYELEFDPRSSIGLLGKEFLSVEKLEKYQILIAIAEKRLKEDRAKKEEAEKLWRLSNTDDVSF